MRALITPKDNEETIYRKIVEKDVCYMTFFKRYVSYSSIMTMYFYFN